MPHESALQEIDLREIPGSLATFERFLELIPDAVVGSYRDGRICVANSQAEEVFGYSRDRLIGVSVEALVPARFRRRHAEHRSAYFAEPHVRPMGAGLDLFALRADGTEFPVEISLSYVSHGDRRITIAAVRDVSDRYGAERERMRLETELQHDRARRVEAMGHLAGGIAHDFNNILGVILTYSELAEEELADRPEAREEIRQIRSAASHASALTRQLLTFAGREVAHPEPLDLNAVLMRLETFLRRALGEQITFIASPQPELWAVVADAIQIEQVIVNLAVNGRDAMPNGGVLEVRTQNMRATRDGYEPVDTRLRTPDVDDCFVGLTVSDTGAGMPADVADRALEPFFTTKSNAMGNGLGLATVHGIVTGLGGEIAFDTAPGQGTSVLVTLPASAAVVVDQAPEGDAPMQGFGETVLIVEDEPALRRSLARTLQRSGYGVIECERARDALELLSDRDRHVDLLLTDVVMPEMRGDELVAEVSKLRPALPVQLMTGYGGEAPVTAGDHRRGILIKPFSRAELLGVVRARLDRAQSASGPAAA